MSSNKLLIAIAVMFLPFLFNIAISQDLPTGECPPGYVAPAPVPFNSDVKSNEASFGYIPNINFNPIDEYGEFSDNAVLTGVSSATEYVNVPHNASFNENFDGSIECWILLNDLSNPSMIISKGTGTDRSFYLIYSPSQSEMQFRIGNTFFTKAFPVTINTWTHVAIVWSGGPSNFTVAFFKDGVSLGTTGPLAATYGLNTSPLRIGGGTEFTSWLRGDIDEVRFWSTARTAAQIAANRFVGLGEGRNSNTGNALTNTSHYTGLVASWNFGNNGTAFDDIGGNNGTYVGCNATNTAGGDPIPYNFVGLFSGGASDYITVPDNAIFDQTAAGSLDAWIYLTTAGALNTIISKGTTFADHSFAFYVSAGNKIGLNIGANNYISTGPTVFQANRWYHVAATWTGGPNFTVRLYVNGVLDHTQSGTVAMPTNASPATIGKYYSAIGFFQGYMDEVRLWSNQLSLDQIKAYMFNSSKGGTMTGLVAAWNFDGNLLNNTSTTGINGAFLSGGNVRFSGYENESTTGTPSTTFRSHTTVINRDITSNPFPSGFAISTPFVTIPDANPTGITSVINLPGSTPVTAVEVFMSIKHTYVADLDITLTAPNGQVRELTTDNGSGGDNILTFFVDGSQTLTSFMAPWSDIVAPEQTMGNFGGSNTQGNWTLTVADDAGGDIGVLQGWGIRLNNTITSTGNENNSLPQTYVLHQNYPNPFNPTTTIKFELPKEQNVTIKVYDLIGKEVMTLVSGVQKAGSYEIVMDGKNLASGAYFYRIDAGDFTDIKKMILIK